MVSGYLFTVRAQVSAQEGNFYFLAIMYVRTCVSTDEAMASPATTTTAIPVKQVLSHLLSLFLLPSSLPLLLVDMAYSLSYFGSEINFFFLLPPS